MLRLAVIGALSLARFALDGVRAWLNGRRASEGIIEEKQDERERGQAEEPRVRNETQVMAPQPSESWREEDQEKVNMQWQILRLEVVVAEQSEKLTETSSTGRSLERTTCAATYAFSWKM